MADGTGAFDRKRAWQAGLLLGTVLGLTWTWRQVQRVRREGVPELIDWAYVERVALEIARRGELPLGNREAARAFYDRLYRTLTPEVAAFTGLRLPPEGVPIRPVTRAEWLQVNLTAFRRLLAPLELLHRSTRGHPFSLPNLILAGPSQTLFSHQFGLLLGYLAQRVLGQYDLSLLAAEGEADPALYLVEPNITALARALGVDAGQLRAYIFLHEITHAFEFLPHPRLSQAIADLLEGYLARLNEEAGAMGEQLAELWRRVLSGRWDESWIDLLLTPRQRELFEKIQGWMAVLEGYSNLVMNRVGARVLPQFPQIHARFEAHRQHRPAWERLFLRLTGLELKMAQYAQGEAFVAAVADRAGLAPLNRALAHPELLPTAGELGDPEGWLRRIGGEEGTPPAPRPGPEAPASPRGRA